jgi:chromate reductase
MNRIKIAVLWGSLRKDSWCKKIACHVAGLLPDAEFERDFVDLADVEMFNQDFDEDRRVPAGWQRFRERIEAADAFLFVTPEYNRSYPAVIKNALDVASRPHGDNRWGGKPAGLIGATIGNLSAVCGVQQLRQPLGFLNIHVMQQPEMYIPHVQELFDKSGNLANEHYRDSLAAYAEALADWCGKFAEQK